jgi:hypothetical protein
MNTIWSLSKSSRYVDRSHNVLAVLAVAAAIQIVLSFQASSFLMPGTPAVTAPVLGTVLSTNAPAHGSLVHAPGMASLAHPAARS